MMVLGYRLNYRNLINTFIFKMCHFVVVFLCVFALLHVNNKYMCKEQSLLIVVMTIVLFY